MRFTHDRRGQSVVIGTVILFGFLILALASYQAFVVPSQNSAAEFDHSQEIQSDMQELRASLLDVREAGAFHRSVRLSLGFRYDQRVIAVNPPPPEGALTTQNRGAIEWDNAEVAAESDAYTNTGPLFEDHETRLLTYRPNYREYRNPPRTTFEHSLLYNRFDGVNRTVTDQRTVDGENRKLTLIAYSGDFDRQGLSTSLDPQTLDGPTPDVRIEADAGDSFNVTLPTHSPSVWTNLIGNTTETGEPNAAVVDNTTESVTIEFESDEPWHLQMARVGYDGGSVDSTPFSNVTRVEDDERVPGAGGNITRTYTVAWNGSGIAAQEDAISYDSTQETLSVDASLIGSAVLMEGTVAEASNPVHNATVDFATSNSSTAGFDAASSTNETVDGRFETQSTIRGVGDGTLYAASGDDVGQISFEVDESFIAGTVTNRSDGSPIGSATVTVYTGDSTDPSDEVASTTTAGDGTYRVDVDPGNYTVVAEASGYDSESALTTVDPATQSTVDLELDPDAQPDEEPRFAEAPTAESDQSGNQVTEVAFEFTVSDPDTVGYEVEFIVENQDGQESVLGPLVEPTSPQVVGGADGDALPNAQMNQGGNFLDISIVLYDNSSAELDRCTGRINDRNELITLECN